MRFNCRKHSPKPIITRPVDPAEPSEISIRFAFVVGHNGRSRGAMNYNSESEWVFNQRIARKAQAKLSDLGFASALIFRPKNGGYSHECGHVRNKAKSLGVEFAFCLHFNAAESSSARGCEVLVHKETRTPKDDKVADFISDLLNERLGIRERGQDGVKFVKRGHNGFGMLDALNSAGVIAVLPEPCFGGFRTKESEAIFENEDAYVDILVEAAAKLLKDEL